MFDPIRFVRYNFYTDGTFKYETGYSGGVYILSIFEGKYTINKENNIISLNVKKARNEGHIKPAKELKKSDLPHKEIKIVGINDTIVAIEAMNSQSIDTIVYYRSPNCMRNQTWNYAKKYTKEYENNDYDIDENDWEHRIEFRDFGQFVYTAGNTWRKYKKITFVGNYHLHDNLVYLNIKTKSTQDANLDINSIQQYDSGKRTYIRVNTKSNKINLPDLMDLIEDDIDKKNWSYDNFKYKTDQPILDSANEEWVEYELY